MNSYITVLLSGGMSYVFYLESIKSPPSLIPLTLIATTMFGMASLLKSYLIVGDLIKSKINNVNNKGHGND